ncbi:hypothetical protein LZ30DRAFT_223252 [Colletotrichum cereale]|nr:hypothetical protein LZ30DRAFT_223252 [Colletotrichum cereale]
MRCPVDQYAVASQAEISCRRCRSWKLCGHEDIAQEERVPSLGGVITQCCLTQPPPPPAKLAQLEQLSPKRTLSKRLQSARVDALLFTRMLAPHLAMKLLGGELSYHVLGEGLMASPPSRFLPRIRLGQLTCYKGFAWHRSRMSPTKSKTSIRPCRVALGSCLRSECNPANHSSEDARRGPLDERRCIHAHERYFQRISQELLNPFPRPRPSPQSTQEP